MSDIADYRAISAHSHGHLLLSYIALLELHLKVNLMDGMGRDDIGKLDLWEETKLPHGRNTGVADIIKEWLVQIQLLP